MPNYKLTYFDITGRAEPIRIMFALAGQKFEDNRITYEEWPQIKPNTPFGQVPILEFDGKTYSQSVAIMNYLATTFNFYGKTPLDRFAVDQAVALTTDAAAAFVAATHDEDEARKAANFKEFMSETAPRFLGYYEKLISDNGAEPHIVGDSFTTADIYAYCFVSEVAALNPALLDNFPKVKSMIDAVETNPRIKAHLAARKK